MSRPNKCKWCGQRAISRDIEEGLEAYGCGSLIYDDGRESQWVKCRLNVAERRIADAVKALETIARHKIEAVYDFGAIGKPDKIGDWVHFEDLEPVVEILEGNSPEIPDDSDKRESEQ